MHEGTVTTLFLDRGYGWIASRDMPDCYFNANDLADDLEFDAQLEQRRVRFEVREFPKGPRAVNVRPVF